MQSEEDGGSVDGAETYLLSLQGKRVTRGGGGRRDPWWRK